jgi:integrase/recombinase XerD
MNELLPIAQERQRLRGAATAARRVIDIGRPRLRFVGWWRAPAAPLPHQRQLYRYVTWKGASADLHHRRSSKEGVRRRES